MIYLSLLIILTFSLSIKNKGLKLKNNKRKKIEDIVFVVIVIAMLSICSLRNTTVGKDTNMYYVLFQGASAFSSLKDYIKSLSYYEYGFWILNYLFSKYLSFQLFLTFIGVLSILPASYIINKYSKNKLLSLILYIGLPFFTMSMQGLRQAVAMGMVMLAYDAIKQEKLHKYLVFCTLAFFCHTSAILFLPAYWIAKIPYKRSLKLIAPIFIVLAFLFKSPLQKLLLLYSRQGTLVYTNIDAGGYRMFLFILMTVILGIFYRSHFINENGQSRNWRELFYFQVVVAMMWPIASFNPAIARMYYYYQMFLVLYIPQLTSNLKNTTEKIGIEFGYIFVAYFFLIFYQLPEFYKLVPYTFFWQ